jgi:hypothetical protein
MTSLQKLLLGSATFALLIGCAVSPADEFPLEQELATEPMEESIKVPAPPPPPSEDAGTDSSTTPPPPPPPPPPPTGGSCAAPSPCSGATHLGNISGDTGAESKTASGSTSQWFKVRVTENEHDVFAVELWMKAQLISPPGSNYDLFVYVGGGCSAPSGQSVATTATDTVSSKFGESGTFSNGGDDSKDITVEVRHVSGPCNASQPWTLNLLGNQ